MQRSQMPEKETDWTAKLTGGQLSSLSELKESNLAKKEKEKKNDQIMASIINIY
jgi:hypothetical protein